MMKHVLGVEIGVNTGYADFNLGPDPGLLAFDLVLGLETGDDTMSEPKTSAISSKAPCYQICQEARAWLFESRGIQAGRVIVS